MNRERLADQRSAFPQPGPTGREMGSQRTISGGLKGRVSSERPAVSNATFQAADAHPSFCKPGPDGPG
jgi:hypothetical protein